MRQYSQEELENMTQEHAEAEIANRAYEAVHLYERLEGVGKVRGNGHHMMQAVAEFAENLMKERFIK